MFIYKLLCKIWQFGAKTNDRLFRHNADFSGWKTQNEAGFSESNGNAYQPSTDALKSVLKHFPITPDDCILDIGCGKGKAMYIMSKFPFSKVHGYDLSQSLVDIANNNFVILKLPQCHACQGDALEYKKYDDYNYFYIFNSFPEEIFKVMFKNILESIDRIPRKCRFIYLNPVCHEYIVNNSSFHIVYKKRSIISWFTYHVYEN